jgi:hypothetical protein
LSNKVEPSMSENNIVTVPVGSSAITTSWDASMPNA